MADHAEREQGALADVIWGILCGIDAYSDDFEYGVVESSRERAHRDLLALWRLTHPEAPPTKETP